MLYTYNQIKQRISKIPLNQSGYVNPTTVSQYLDAREDLKILTEQALDKINFEVEKKNKNAIKLYNFINSKQPKMEISIYKFLINLKSSYVMEDSDNYVQSKRLDNFRHSLFNNSLEQDLLTANEIYTSFFGKVDKL